MFGFRKKVDVPSPADLAKDACRALFDHLPDCLLLCDQSGRIIDATHSALDLFGYSRAEFDRLELAHLFPEDSGAAAKAELKGIFSASVARFELQCRRFEFCPEFTGRALQAGFKIHEVPISYNPRGILEGKKIKASDGFVALYWLIKAWLSQGQASEATAEGTR